MPNTHLHTKKSQAMFLVLFLLAVFGALSGALTVMWSAEILTRSSDRDGLIAFYLAQAGIERAKIEIINSVTFSGNSPLWYSDIDVAGDTYIFRYNCNVVISGTQRTITARGEVLDAGAAIVLAHREIQVTVDGIQDTDFDGDDDNPPNNTLQAWSWREI